MKNLKKEKGITLIALVVTIVVVLILASVSINTLFGQNGLIKKAKEATTKYSEAEKEDLESLKKLENFMDKELADIETTPIESEIKPGEKAVGGNKKYIDSKGRTAIIPEGFAVSGIEGEKIIDQGLVIYDFTEVEDISTIDWTSLTLQETYNQFVWIPVENEAEYVRNFTYPSLYDSELSYTPENSTYTDVSYLPEGIFNLQPVKNTKEDCEKAERLVVVESKGFYIGRYEAGGTESMATCKKDEVKVNISQENCRIASKAMYNDKYKASALCSGIQWDMVMQEVNGKNDGSNPAKKFDVKIADSSRHVGESIAVSANNLADKVYNIYDLEGNACEYVAEKNSTDRSFVKRGGYFKNHAIASGRYNGSGYDGPYGSFRPVLYVK